MVGIPCQGAWLCDPQDQFVCQVWSVSYEVRVQSDTANTEMGDDLTHEARGSQTMPDSNLAHYRLLAMKEL